MEEATFIHMTHIHTSCPIHGYVYKKKKKITHILSFHVQSIGVCIKIKIWDIWHIFVSRVQSMGMCIKKIIYIYICIRHISVCCVQFLGMCIQIKKEKKSYDTYPHVVSNPWVCVFKKKKCIYDTYPCIMSNPWACVCRQDSLCSCTQKPLTTIGRALVYYERSP